MKSIKIKKSALVLISAAAIFTSAFMIGCSEDSITSTNNGTSDNMSVSVMNDENITDNSSDSIIIDEAKALINEVEFEQEPSGIEKEVHIAPFVVHFNITGLTTIITGQLPEGSYNKIKFKIHKPEDNETPLDPEFKEGTSGNQRFSFIIKGRINGVPFVYKSRKTLELVINLNSSVTVNGSRNITVAFNKNFWFRNGSIIIDPRDPQNDDMVDDNIHNSFRHAFRDDDKDGHEDH